MRGGAEKSSKISKRRLLLGVKCPQSSVDESLQIQQLYLFKYRRYFNRSACVSVCLSVCFRQNNQKIGLVIIVYTPVLSTTGSYWFLSTFFTYKFFHYLIYQRWSQTPNLNFFSFSFAHPPHTRIMHGEQNLIALTDPPLKETLFLRCFQLSWSCHAFLLATISP